MDPNQEKPVMRPFLSKKTGMVQDAFGKTLADFVAEKRAAAEKRNNPSQDGASSSSGQPIEPTDAHIRLAAMFVAHLNGAQQLRRLDGAAYSALPRNSTGAPSGYKERSLTGGKTVREMYKAMDKRDVLVDHLRAARDNNVARREMRRNKTQESPAQGSYLVDLSDPPVQQDIPKWSAVNFGGFEQRKNRRIVELEDMESYQKGQGRPNLSEEVKKKEKRRAAILEAFRLRNQQRRMKAEKEKASFAALAEQMGQVDLDEDKDGQGSSTQ